MKVLDRRDHDVRPRPVADCTFGRLTKCDGPSWPPLICESVSELLDGRDPARIEPSVRRERKVAPRHGAERVHTV